MNAWSDVNNDVNLVTPHVQVCATDRELNYFHFGIAAFLSRLAPESINFSTFMVTFFWIIENNINDIFMNNMHTDGKLYVNFKLYNIFR